MDALLIWFGLLMVSSIINTAGIRIADAIRYAYAIHERKTGDKKSGKEGTP